VPYLSVLEVRSRRCAIQIPLPNCKCCNGENGICGNISQHPVFHSGSCKIYQIIPWRPLKYFLTGAL